MRSPGLPWSILSVVVCPVCVSTAPSSGCLIRARPADGSAGQCATRDRHSAIGCTSRDADVQGTPARLQKVWREDGSDPCWLGRVCLSPGGLSDQPCGAHISVTRSPRPGPVHQGHGGLWLAGEPQAGRVCWSLKRQRSCDGGWFGCMFCFERGTPIETGYQSHLTNADRGAGDGHKATGPACVLLVTDGGVLVDRRCQRPHSLSRASPLPWGDANSRTQPGRARRAAQCSVPCHAHAISMAIAFGRVAC